MAKKTSMLETFKKKGFRFLTDLIRQTDLIHADSGFSAINPVGCIVFLEPCRLSFKYCDLP